MNTEPTPSPEDDDMIYSVVTCQICRAHEANMEKGGHRRPVTHISGPMYDSIVRRLERTGAFNHYSFSHKAINESGAELRGSRLVIIPSDRYFAVTKI